MIFRKSNSNARKFVGILVLCTLILTSWLTISQKSRALSTRQKEVAEQIANICIAEWDNYGILPSTALAQAFGESGLGKGNYMFGVNGSRGLGVEASTYNYFRCLYNSVFKGRMAFKTTPEEQLASIFEGGEYCPYVLPGGHYYRSVLNAVDKYGWRKYDKKLFRNIAKRRKQEAARRAKKLRKQRQKRPFHIELSDELGVGECCVDPLYIKKGSVVIFGSLHLEATKTKKNLKNTIIIGMGKDTFDNNIRDFSFFKDCKYVIYLKEVIENVRG